MHSLEEKKVLKKQVIGNKLVLKKGLSLSKLTSGITKSTLMKQPSVLLPPQRQSPQVIIEESEMDMIHTAIIEEVMQHADTPISDDDLFQLVVNRVPNHVDVKKYIISHRYELLSTIGITTVGGLVAIGMTSTVAGGLPTITAVSTIAQLMAKNMIIRKALTTIATSRYVMSTQTNTTKIFPPHIRKLLVEYGVDDSIVQLTIGTLTKKLVHEGLQVYMIQDVYKYLFTSLLPNILLNKALSKTHVAMTYLRLFRFWCSDKGTRLIARFAAEIPAEEEEDLILLPIIQSMDTQTIQPIPIPVIHDHPLIAAATLGTGIAMGLLHGQMLSEAASSILQSIPIKDLALSGLVQGSEYHTYLQRLQVYLTDNTIGRLNTLREPLLDPNRRSVYVQEFYAWVLGKTIYSEQDISRLTQEQLDTIFQEQGIRYESGWRTTEAMRKHLLQHQQALFHITRLQLIQSMSLSVLKEGSGLAMTVGLGTIYTAINLPSVSELIGLTPEEVIKANKEMDPVVLQKVDEYLTTHPELTEVMNHDVGNRREEFQRIREERHILRQIINQQYQDRRQGIIEKYATKFKIDASGIQRLDELQHLIEIQTRVTPTTRLVELGSIVNENDLIPKEIAERLKSIQWDNAYILARNHMIDVVTTSTIPVVGPLLPSVNLAIDALNYGKNTYNLGIAVNELLQVNEYIRENAGYLPMENIPNIPSLSWFITSQLDSVQQIDSKINLYSVVLSSLKNKIVYDWSNQQFIADITRQAVGGTILSPLIE